jgi:hypothetical protein
MKKSRAFAAFITVLVLPTFLWVPQGKSAESGSNFWYGYWHEWQYYTEHPLNISTTTTVYDNLGNKWFEAALVVSIYQYEPFMTGATVNCRVALYFDSFAQQGLFPVPARLAGFHIEKDGGSELDHEQMIFLVDSDRPPGYSQGRGLWQTTSIPSTSQNRIEWSLSALGFAVGLFREPLGIALELISLASSFFSAPGVDFRNAGAQDFDAVSVWNGEADFGTQNPLRQYSLNTVQWTQDPDTNPSSYYGIKIYAKVDLESNDNPFGFTSFYTDPVFLRIYRSGHGAHSGSGCPYVLVWNGSQYALDNNVLPRAESSNGTDVADYYKLEQTLASRQCRYSLVLSEFEQEHSYVDQVRLLAVDHASDVNTAVTPEGEILTYKNPSPPMSAVDNNGTERLSAIGLMDGNVSDPATYFYGEAGEYLVLDFGQVNSDNAKLILRDDMKCEECCIDVQVLNASGEWQTVTRLAPRTYWAVEGVNLSQYNVHGQELKVRLLWTSPHRLDFVGLDTTQQDDYTIHRAILISAIHSTQGNVRALLTQNDNHYAELVPGQHIQLVFTLPNNLEEARTFIFYTEGHYYTIPQP